MGGDIRRVLRITALVSLVIAPASEGGQVERFGELASALKPGDVVAVTDWSGKQTTGHVLELTACSLVLVTSDRRVEIPATETRIIKRLRRAETRSMNDSVVDAGRVCRQAACVAVTLAVGSTMAVKRGIERLFHRPPTVYQAPANSPAAECSALPVSRRDEPERAALSHS